jgi:hypothetical protein
MRRSVLAALALLVGIASGCYVNRLDARYHLRLDNGLCGWNVVIDQNTALWKASGCENGYPIAQRVRRLKPEEHEVEPCDREGGQLVSARPVAWWLPGGRVGW